MRLGKEEAVGYVEDTEAEPFAAEVAARDIAAERQAPLSPADKPVLPVG